MQTTQQTTQTGFTLIELLIAVAIVALLAAIAVPNYNQYVERARRADATTALTRTAGQLERCYTQFGVYNHASCASYTIVKAGGPSSNCGSRHGQGQGDEFRGAFDSRLGFMGCL